MKILPMVAKLPEAPTSNGKNFDGDKELVNRWQVVALTRDGELKLIIDCRCWMGRSRSSSKVYATLWAWGHSVGDESRSYVGRGTAGGYGYHKQSAAIQGAISSAGVELFGSVCGFPLDSAPDYSKKVYIDGAGDSAIHSALLAIAQAMGYDIERCIIV